MTTTPQVSINKPGSEFHQMTGEVLRVVEGLSVCEVYLYSQKMNSTRTWRGSSWMFTTVGVSAQ